MRNVPTQFKTLSPAVIEASPEIQQWVAQFPDGQQTTAKVMLSRLKFVSRDVYSTWLRRVVSGLPEDKTYALYSVRKLPEGKALWEQNGAIVARPGDSQGSEDLVYSLISNLSRADPQILLDHSPLDELREKRFMIMY